MQAETTAESNRNFLRELIDNIDKLEDKQRHGEQENTDNTFRTAIEMELQPLSSYLFAPDSWINCLFPLCAQLDGNLC